MEDYTIALNYAIDNLRINVLGISNTNDNVTENKSSINQTNLNCKEIKLETQETIENQTHSSTEVSHFDTKAHLKQHGKKLRRCSIVFGIVALVCSVSIVLGIILGLLAIILNAISRKVTHKNCTQEQKNVLKKYKKTGFVLGTIAIIISVLWFAFLTVFFIFFADFSQTISSIYPDYNNIEYFENVIQYIQDVIDSVKNYWNI